MFRRKSSRPSGETPESSEPATAPSAEQPAGAPEDAQGGPAEQAGQARPPGGGPYDVSELADDVERVDVGSLLLAPSPGREIRLQVVEKTGEVAGAMLVGAEGAMELQAFSAPRNGDLWSQVRPQIAADVERRGGRVAERQGPFGVELMCQVPVKTPEGETGVQPSRIIGVNGPRWMLRATLLGRPAIDVSAGAEWETALAQVAVRRGDHAMPVGRVLPLKLPDDARKAT